MLNLYHHSCQVRIWDLLDGGTFKEVSDPGRQLVLALQEHHYCMVLLTWNTHVLVFIVYIIRGTVGMAIGKSLR